MQLNLEIDAGIGRGAIWKGEGRDPFTEPRANLDRVLWHSALDYIRVVETRTFTLNLPARTNFYQDTASYTLFAHGRAGIPFILGDVGVNGEPVGFVGSVPVQMGVVNPLSGNPGVYGRWLALGADFDNIVVHEYVVNSAAGGPSGFGEYDAISVPITVHVTSKILEGPDVPPPQADLEISGARFALGPLDTDQRYIRRVSNPARRKLNMARGPAIAVNARNNNPGSIEAWALTWRWRAGAATQTAISGFQPDGMIPDGHNQAVDIAL